MRAFAAELVPRPPLGTPTSDQFDLSLPTDLEIGAGNGRHAVTYAINHPNRQLIALERTTRAYKMIHRLRQQPQIKNLLPARADAVNWVTHFIGPSSLERVFILYPNPYPKTRQKNLRWHNMPFMGFLKSRMRPGAKLILATNEEFYRDEAVSVLTTQWLFNLESERQLDRLFTPRTDFESKYLARGHRCWSLEFSI